MLCSTHNLEQNGHSQPSLDAKRIFKQEMVKFQQNAVYEINVMVYFQPGE